MLNIPFPLHIIFEQSGIVDPGPKCPKCQKWVTVTPRREDDDDEDADEDDDDDDNLRCRSPRSGSGMQSRNYKCKIV